MIMYIINMWMADIVVGDLPKSTLIDWPVI